MAQVELDMAALEALKARVPDPRHDTATVGAVTEAIP